MVARMTITMGTLAAASSVNPVDKVISLMNDLQTKVKKEGEVEAKAFKEFFHWCTDAARNTDFQIQTAKRTQEKLEAAIGKAVADREASESVIDEMARTIAAAEKDLEEATEIRKKEKTDFKEVEAELHDAVDTLSRAIGALEREMAKNPALVQSANTKDTQALMKALDTFVSAAGVGSSDKEKLLTLVQSQQTGTDDDDEFGAPQAAGYKSQSGSIIDILEDMKEKAEGELAEAQKAESTAAHNFAMVKQSLEDQISADTKEKTEAENTKHTSTETKAVAEGDLKATVEDLNNSLKNKDTVATDCMTAAADQEASLKSREEELAVLAKAKEIVQEGAQGAKKQTSFLQTDDFSFSYDGSDSVNGVRVRTRMMLTSHADLKNIELVAMLKKLAEQQHSHSLAQLASRVKETFRYGSLDGQDPFVKVRQMITDMITKLGEDGNVEAGHKAYCDEEMAKTKDKKDELGFSNERIETALHRAVSKSTNLKNDVAQLSKDIADIARSQAEMDSARADENAAFREKKDDMDQGIKAVQNALTMLRDYYSKDSDPALLDFGDMQPSKPAGHQAADGAASGVISMLEVIESDFSKALVEAEMSEGTSASNYAQTSQENKVTRSLKEQDVKYKSQESKSLDVSISEMNGELNGQQNELSAVMEYADKLESMCVAKPDSYEERVKRREAEIAGLREALNALDSAAMLQKSKRAGSLLQRSKHGHL